MASSSSFSKLFAKPTRSRPPSQRLLSQRTNLLQSSKHLPEEKQAKPSFHNFPLYLDSLTQFQLAKFIVNNVTENTIGRILSSDHALNLMLAAKGKDKVSGDEILSFLRNKSNISKEELIAILLQAIDYNSKIEYQDFLNEAKEKYESNLEKLKSRSGRTFTLESNRQALELAEVKSRILDNQIEKFVDRMNEQNHRDEVKQSLDESFADSLAEEEALSLLEEVDNNISLPTLMELENDFLKNSYALKSLANHSFLKPGKNVDLELQIALEPTQSEGKENFFSTNISGKIAFIEDAFNPGSIGITLDDSVKEKLPYLPGNVVLEKVDQDVWMFTNNSPNFSSDGNLPPWRIILDRS